MKQFLVQWGPFLLPSYGFFVGLAYALGMYLSEKRAREIGIARFKLMDATMIAFIGAIIGSRLLFVLFSGEQERNVDVLGGGRSFYAGLIGATAAGIVWLRLRSLPVLKCLDCVFLYVPLAHAVGRLGCWYFGCCYGRRASPGFPFAVEFPKLLDHAGKIGGSPAFQRHVEKHWISASKSWSLPVYPTQLLAIIVGLLIFIVLRCLCNNRHFLLRPGSITLLYMVLYGIARTMEECFREGWRFFDIATDSQIFSVGLSLFGVMGLIRLFNVRDVCTPRRMRP